MHCRSLLYMVGKIFLHDVRNRFINIAYTMGLIIWLKKYILKKKAKEENSRGVMKTILSTFSVNIMCAKYVMINTTVKMNHMIVFVGNLSKPFVECLTFVLRLSATVLLVSSSLSPPSPPFDDMRPSISGDIFNVWLLFIGS